MERARGVHRQPQQQPRAGVLRRVLAQVPDRIVLRPDVRVEPRTLMAAELRRRRERRSHRGRDASVRPARAGTLAQVPQLRAEQPRVRADHRRQRRIPVRRHARRVRDTRVHGDDVRLDRHRAVRIRPRVLDPTAGVPRFHRAGNVLHGGAVRRRRAQHVQLVAGRVIG